MRELRFRAWNTVRNCWTSRVELDGGWGKPMFLHGEIENDSGYQTDNAIIEQYTGLKDKNGKEIYEGDIVEYDWYIIGDKPAYRTKELVVFDDMGARVGNDRLRNCTNIEVIGNTHENPELLGEDEE